MTRQTLMEHIPWQHAEVSLHEERFRPAEDDQTGVELEEPSAEMASLRSQHLSSVGGAAGLENRIAHADEPRTQAVRLRGEVALVCDVCRLALGGLDADRFDVQRPEVVRRRPHVDLPHLARELEAVGYQLRGRERRELVRPLVTVHSGVEATWLLVRLLLLAGRLEQVEGPLRPLLEHLDIVGPAAVPPGSQVRSSMAWYVTPVAALICWASVLLPEPVTR